jgi:hypothetical protein
VIAVGRLTGWTCLIRPFYDRLDVEIPFLFYAVPDSAPAGPDTVFTDRFWDDREHYFPPGVGVVPGSTRPYFGPLPPQRAGAIEGTPDQWVNGFSYAAWQQGAYNGSCWPVYDNVKPFKIKQAQQFTVIQRKEARLDQVQAISLYPYIPARMDQAQAVAARGASGYAGQVQDFVVYPLSGRMDQEQSLVEFGATGNVGQVQDFVVYRVSGRTDQAHDFVVYHLAGEIDQAQALSAYGTAGEIDQAQALSAYPAEGDVDQAQALSAYPAEGDVDQAQAISAQARTGTIDQAQNVTLVYSPPTAVIPTGPYSFVQQVTHAGSGSFTASLPSTTTAGQALFVFITLYGENAAPFNLTVSDNNGTLFKEWIRGSLAGDGQSRCAIWAGTVSGRSGHTVTVSGASFLTFCCAVYTGNVASLGALKTSSSGIGNSTSPASGNVTTTTGSDMLVGLVAWGTTNATVTIPAGFTNRYSNNNGSATEGCGIADRGTSTGVSPGTYGYSPTITTSQNWAALLAAFA